MTGGNVIFMPGVPRCELCECGIARGCINGVWLCETCAEQTAAVPAPVHTPPRDEARFGPSLADIVERLVRGDG